MKTPHVSKQQRCIDILKRPQGAMLAELAEITGWQAHSIRGFLSGTVKKKLGLNLVSSEELGSRRYAVCQPKRPGRKSKTT
ncbi:MAG: DUF3489 domain-containing protein [Hyphomicrobiaceae bacterium]|nr:DUF3489 domain-containing protein [Hyphomicrobiaceae bacterium]